MMVGSNETAFTGGKELDWALGLDPNLVGDYWSLTSI